MKLDKYMVGRRYGKALFEAARDKEQLSVVYPELRKLRKIFEELPDLGNILTDVRLEPYEKDEIFKTLVPHFSGLVEDFLKIVYDYHRLDSIPLMIDEFEHRYDAYRGILYGTVKSVQPLTPQQLAALEKNLEPITQSSQVKLTNQLDPTILGGVVIEANGTVIDGSLKMRLTQIKKALLD